MQAVHAEWTKLRTVPGTGWLLLGAAALTAAFSVLAVAAVSAATAPPGLDVTKQSLIGVHVGQLVFVILAVTVISGEYGTGMIRGTFAAMPGRGTVLAAKAAVVAAAVLVAGTAGVLGSFIAGRIMLSRNGFTESAGYRLLSLADGATLRAVAGSVLYLTLISLLGLGVATLVREPATAIGSVLGLLYLFPILAEVVADPDWRRHLQQIGPASAGLAVQATTDLGELPISPWRGLGVLALWAAGALVLGAAVLRHRDA
jgi:ABC-2 type transport system permease protein